MAQVFDNGWDEKIVDKKFSEPTEDVYFEVSRPVYYEEPLTVYQEKACEDLINPVIKLGRS